MIVFFILAFRRMLNLCRLRIERALPTGPQRGSLNGKTLMFKMACVTLGPAIRLLTQEVNHSLGQSFCPTCLTLTTIRHRAFRCSPQSGRPQQLLPDPVFTLFPEGVVAASYTDLQSSISTITHDNLIILSMVAQDQATLFLPPASLFFAHSLRILIVLTFGSRFQSMESRM